MAPVLTGMASFFYAMMRLLHRRDPLLATIHNQKFMVLRLTETAKRCVYSLEGKNF